MAKPLSEDAREALEAMLSSVIKKYSHEPISYLKQHCAESGLDRDETERARIDLIRRIFNLDADRPQRGRH